MICDLSKTKLYLYYDKILAERENSEVAEHIESCAFCKSEIEFLNTLDGAFKRENVVYLPSRLKSDLLKLGKRNLSIRKIFYDILKIIINAKSLILHIPDQLERELNTKYNEKVTRWIFFC
ncbi:MAG: hypothetical protein M5R37_06940 [Melioribacteraceae bacterium]|jgi:hypothetical protein|nr:hypothetical protein [Melioribacteraceae bacterium]